MGFTDTSQVWRVAFYFTVIGFLLTLTGTASSHMASSELIPNMRIHLGFWDICDDTKSFSCRTVIEFLIATEGDNDWVYGSRAMAVLSLIFQGCAAVFSLYLTYVMSSSNFSGFIIGSMDMAAALFGTIGGAVFLSYGLDLLESTALSDADPSWSFALYIIGQAFAFTAGIMNYYDACTDHME